MKDNAMGTPVKRFLTLVLTTFLGGIAQTVLAGNSDSRAAADSTGATADVRTEMLDTSFVSATEGKKQVSGLLSGNLSLDMSMLSTLPKFLGTNDIMKTLQLMPGIQTSGELDSGIYIRGGDAGHSAIMLDGATVYNPAHLMGFFSIFNSDHLKSSTLYKSDIPANYGGRLGGVVDISVKDEMLDRAEGDVNIGLLSSQATLGVPIGKKSAMYLSGRASYFNYMLSGIARVMNGAAAPDYFFQDWNITWAFRPDERNSVRINGYYGGDRMSFSQRTYQADAGLRWHNAAASVTWDSKAGERTDMKHSIHFSMFDNHVQIAQGGVSFGLPSSIMDAGYRGSLEFPLPLGKMKAGWDYVYHHTEVQHPATDNLYGFSAGNPPAPYHTHEFGASADWSVNFAAAFTLNAGLRYSGYIQSGLHGTTPFYGGPEPRLSLSYEISPTMRMQAAYALQRQYIGQVSVSGMGLPTDFWIPASARIRPQSAHSTSLGFFHSFGNGMFEYGIEAYYKRLSGLLEFDGALFDMINMAYNVEDHLMSGTGNNYGIELMFKKNYGKVSGWLSYTLGRAERSFPGIMDGKTFPSKHDRRHNLSLAVTWNPHRRWDLSAVFIYASGTAFTMPTALYMVGENMIHEYGPHNGDRMPDYHRLDLSATYLLHTGRRFKGSLNLSVYNAYARENPLYLDVKVYYDKETENISLSLIGQSLYSILPSLSYRLEF